MPALPPLPTLPINPEDARHLAWLDSIQGNMVKGHGREFTRLLFFSFQRTAPENLRLLPAAVAAKRVTSGGEQYRQARSGRRDAPFYSLGFTEEFFWACRFSRAFPPGHDAFQAGMKSRLLQIRGEPETEQQWDWVYRKVPHGMWLLAHAQHAKLDEMQREVVNLLTQHRAALLGTVEEGRRWSDDAGGKLIREPFGFRDGLSQMDFFAPPAATPAHVRVDLDRVVMTEGVHAGGSFLVLRKLDQNVKAFRDFEAAMAGAYRKHGTDLPAREAGALLVGRERDGTPLAELASARPNDFDFQKDGTAARCPFHAHIRKANPRTDDPAATDRGIPHRDAQFVRRSAVYDEAGRLPRRASERYAGGETITGGVGLLFMGYMRDIQAQFERMQLQWFSDPDFPVRGAGLADPLIRGALAGAPDWRWNGVTVPGLAKFVSSRGGAYFYMPSMAWLTKPAA